MEQIALFVLPGSSEEKGNEDYPDNDSDDGADPSRPSASSKLRILSKRAIYTAQTFVKTGSINSYDDGGYTALHNAVKLGDIKTIALFLESGANPTAVTKQDELQPIHIAA
ncbi:hypothetical protein FPQ18DRAFT_408592 [Pyronema domesticum]|nr:hypothetical protein FPQ18DRAFT_408592 [Pyronema domesticum]